MIVVVDPNLKQLFFDKLMEMCGNSQYDVIKLIESVAHGEKTILASSDIEEYIQQIKSLEKHKEAWRLEFQRESKRRGDLQRKLRRIDEEIDSYLDEIEQYRSIITNAGLQEYI